MIKRNFIPSLLLLTIFVPIYAQSDSTIIIDKDIQLYPVGDSIYVHVSWHHLDGFGRFPSNGLIVIRHGQALMIDTPMDNAKTERLIKFLEDKMKVKVAKLIIGHFHGDCMGGLEYIQNRDIESIANSLTIKKCQSLGLPIPSTAFTDSLTFDFNGKKIVCRYFGGGHTADNIVVWLPDKQVLFGGCLIRSSYSKNLGNLSDAMVADWDTTVQKLMKAYPEIRIVVPGHGRFGRTDLLTHTIDLVKKQKEN